MIKIAYWKHEAEYMWMHYKMNDDVHGLCSMVIENPTGELEGKGGQWYWAVFEKDQGFELTLANAKRKVMSLND